MTTALTTGSGLDAETRELLAGSLRELLAAHTDAASIAAALAELGWDEVWAGDPATATTLLFTEHGRALATSRVLDDVLLAELAPALPAPTGPRAVLYPHPADKGDLVACGAPLRGLLLGRLDGVAEVVVPAVDADSAVLLVVPAAKFADATAPTGGFDPQSGWLAVARGPVPDGISPVRAADAWTRAQAAGHRALATEIAGVCEAALALATAHTAARWQYGRPIASFQAVRHRLAEAHVAVVAARTTVEAAWAMAGEPDGGAWAARIAKLRAGRAQADVLRHTVQVLGAMGLTLESEMHRFVTRAAALDALLGDHLSLAEATGTELLAGTEPHPVVEI